MYQPENKQQSIVRNFLDKLNTSKQMITSFCDKHVFGQSATK